MSLALGASLACDNGTALPTAPTTLSDPPPIVFAIEGVVRNAGDQRGIAGAHVEVAEGANQGSSAATDGEGRYRLANLPSGTLVLRAMADGFEAGAQSVALSANQSVDFALQKPPADGPDAARRTLSGTVLSVGADAPIRGARVEIENGPDRGRSTETDARGGYRLSVQPGALSLEVSADHFVSASRRVSVDSDVVVNVSLEPEATSAPTGPIVTGTTVDGVSNDTVSGALIRVDSGAEAKSDADGTFVLALSEPDPVLDVTITSSSTVTRATHLRVSDGPATLTLIPRALNLAAFNQMFRGNGGVLHRWTAAPQIVIERRVLRFTGVSDDAFVATADVMSDEDVDSLLDDLTWALSQLTGETFDRFLDTRVETASEGADVAIARPATIVVAHFEGLTAETSYWGYTRWAWNGRGEVRTAAIMLDRTFETSGSAYRRSLRAHELGHALGYGHVDARASVMNQSGRVLPNSFDRSGARIAFQRQPLNMSPDVDPAPTTVSRAPAGGLTWTGAH